MDGFQPMERRQVSSPSKDGSATVLQLAENLQRLLSTSVLDQTGLTGKYNFKLEFERADDPSDYTAVVAAIRQLGLKLEKYKGPVEFLVIDHLDKLVEN